MARSVLITPPLPVSDRVGKAQGLGDADIGGGGLKGLIGGGQIRAARHHDEGKPPAMRSAESSRRGCRRG